MKATLIAWMSPWVLALVVTGAGCQKASAVSEQLLYLDSVDGPATVSVGDAAVYTIHGHKPDPAWSVDAPAIQLDGAAVTVDVIGHRASKRMAIQMLTPFTTTATLSDLPAGSFTVRFKGRQQTLERSLSVLAKHDLNRP